MVNCRLYDVVRVVSLVLKMIDLKIKISKQQVNIVLRVERHREADRDYRERACGVWIGGDDGCVE